MQDWVIYATVAMFFILIVGSAIAIQVSAYDDSASRVVGWVSLTVGLVALGIFVINMISAWCTGKPDKPAPPPKRKESEYTLYTPTGKENAPDSGETVIFARLV